MNRVARSLSLHRFIQKYNFRTNLELMYAACQDTTQATKSLHDHNYIVEQEKG